MSDKPDFWNLVAIDQGVPDGWQWTSSEAISGGFLVSGAVCTAVYKSGPRKGRKNWSKRDKATERKIFISDQELADRHARWERDTGKCVECLGTGAKLVGWSAKDGDLTCHCRRCNSTGAAPSLETEAPGNATNDTSPRESGTEER